MSSTYKTPYLGLNKYIGTDKPKMDDYNYDNNQLENKIKAHFESNIHVTEAEKSEWSKSAFTIGSYQGDGTGSRSITLGFNPSFGIVFTADELTNAYLSTQTQNEQQMGIFTQQGKTLGMQAFQNGFQVSTITATTPDGRRPKLNVAGKTYIYIMFP